MADWRSRASWKREEGYGDNNNGSGALLTYLPNQDSITQHCEQLDCICYLGMPALRGDSRMKYWIAYRDCECVEAVAPETASMIPQGADCEFVRLAVAKGFKTRLTAEGEQAPTVGPCAEHAAIQVLQPWLDSAPPGDYNLSIGSTIFKEDAMQKRRDTAAGPGEKFGPSWEREFERPVRSAPIAPGSPVAAPLEEKPTNGAEYTLERVVTSWGPNPPEGPHVHSGTLEELDQRIANGDLVIASQEEHWTYPLIAPPSGAGESERRSNMEFESLRTWELRKEGQTVATVLPSGAVEIAGRTYSELPLAVAGLRALADELEGKPKGRKQRKAKE